MDSELNHERPNHVIYPVEKESHNCGFCQQPSSSEVLREKLGPVYGPIKISKKSGKTVWVHELCAIWTPEVYLDVRNKFQNMKKAIKRCSPINCSFCAEKGAGLGCFVQDCPSSYHYLCAKEAGCLLISGRFIQFCPDHMQEVPEEYRDCLDESNSQLEGYICVICKSGLDENEIMLCEKCDLGFHANCHNKKYGTKANPK